MELQLSTRNKLLLPRRIIEKSRHYSLLFWESDKKTIRRDCWRSLTGLSEAFFRALVYSRKEEAV